MRSRVIEEYKKRLFLNKKQREILIGLLLGDGHLEKLYTSTLSRLKIEHSYIQKDYVDWLYKEFKNWVRTKPKIRKMKRWGKMGKNYRFSTYGHKLLGEFRTRFYNGKEKIVPNNLEKDITSLGLAIWFMDDGSIKSINHKGIFLNTQGFKESSIIILQKMLESKFKITSTTRKDKNGSQIYLGGEAGERFIALIKPHIISSMEYKIPRVLRLTKLPKE